VQFLHHRGIVHLSIQPDNIIMQSRRRFDVKLVDFGRAQRITTMDGVPVDRVGSAEFMGQCYNFILSCLSTPLAARCTVDLKLILKADRAIEIRLMPSTHHRRDSTVELSCVGGVHTLRN